MCNVDVKPKWFVMFSNVRSVNVVKREGACVVMDVGAAAESGWGGVRMLVQMKSTSVRHKPKLDVLKYLELEADMPLKS